MLVEQLDSQFYQQYNLVVVYTYNQRARIYCPGRSVIILLLYFGDILPLGYFNIAALYWCVCVMVVSLAAYNKKQR